MDRGSQKLLGEVEKNSVERIRIYLCHFRDDYVDIRIWLHRAPGELGNLIPTKKGLTFHAELLPEVIEALKRAEKMIEGEDV